MDEWSDANPNIRLGSVNARLLVLGLDHSQNYAFIWHLVAFHFICITFAFRIAPRISIFALHFISI